MGKNLVETGLRHLIYVSHKANGGPFLLGSPYLFDATAYAEYLFGIDLGIDELLFRDPDTPDALHPGAWRR